MGSWVLLHGLVVGLDMMQVKDLACRCHRWCWGRTPSYCLHCCPVLWGLEATSLKQKIRKASFILSFNWSCGQGLCLASGPLAVSRGCGDTAWGLIHPFWKKCLFWGGTGDTKKSVSAHFSQQRDDFTLCALKFSKDRCPVTSLSHDHLWEFFLLKGMKYLETIVLSLNLPAESWD